MTSRPEDRELTAKEWSKVEEQINEIQERQALIELGDMLIAQKKTISFQHQQLEDQLLYIRMLEDLSTQRQTKLERLEKTLERLETQLARLK